MRGDTGMHTGFSVAVRTYEQLERVIDFLSQGREKGASIVRILVDGDLYTGDRRAPGLIQKAQRDKLGQVSCGSGNSSRLPEPEWILSLPAVLRGPDRGYLSAISDVVRDENAFCGLMTGSLEGLSYFLEQDYPGRLYADANFYFWNSAAVSVWEKMLCGACLPLELTAGEQRELMRASSIAWEKMVYGRIPMMVTANCAAKTLSGCRRNVPTGTDSDGTDSDVLWLRDRLGKNFPVLLNCRHCYNVIYNSVPLSLHGEIGKWMDKAVLRLQFTIESGEETAACLGFFLHGSGGTMKREDGTTPFGEYTTGHEKRGVQ